MSLVEGQPRTSPASSTSPASTTLAWLVAAALLAGLVWAGGLWNQLANSRVLDLLMRSGVVAFTDADQGFYKGVPETKYYVASQDPVDWGMLAVTVAVLVGVMVLRGLGFAAVARFLGAVVARSAAATAYVRGLASGAFRPFGLGRASMATSLEELGVMRRTANGSLVLVRFVHLCTLAVFTAIGLITLSWSTALGQLVWPVGIVAVAYFLVRPARSDPTAARPFDGFGQAASILAQEPSSFARIAVLHLIAFFGEVIAVYTLSQSFTSANVILNIDFQIVLMAVVAAHVASYVDVTPGGLGQFEWGMAMALYIGGTGMPESVTIPLLYAVLRYAVLGVTYLVTRAKERSSPASYDLMDELERG